MLSKVYRVGPERQVVVRGQTVQCANIRDIQESLSSSIGPWAVSQTPRSPNCILLSRNAAWLHTEATRDDFFRSLAEAQKTLAARIQKKGGQLLPSAVRSGTGYWKQYLCPDRHLIEITDQIERTIYCNLLRIYSPAFVVAFGRAGVSTTNVDSGHSRLVLEDMFFPCRTWVSTEKAFLDRLEPNLRRFDGIPQLDAIEISPRSKWSANFVQSVLADGPVTLPFVRAGALLHQAVFLRARRLARSGQNPPTLRQDVAERNRSRTAVDGPRARLEPKGLQAALQMTTLIRDLREELQTLEASWKELAPLLLGPMLRQLGYSALQNENELLRLMAQEARHDEKRFSGDLAALLNAPIDEDPVTRRNRDKFASIAQEIAEWWAQWLKDSPETLPSRRSETAFRPDYHVQQRNIRGPQKAREARAYDRQKERIENGFSVRDLLRELMEGERPTAEKQRLALLKFTDVERLSREVRMLDHSDRRSLERLLAPWGGSVKAAQNTDQFWDEPAIKDSLAFAMRVGIGVVAIEAPEARETELGAWLNQFRRKQPSNWLVFPWRRVRYQGKIRREFIVLPKEWQHEPAH